MQFFHFRKQTCLFERFSRFFRLFREKQKSSLYVEGAPPHENPPGFWLLFRVLPPGKPNPISPCHQDQWDADCSFRSYRRVVVSATTQACGIHHSSVSSTATDQAPPEGWLTAGVLLGNLNQHNRLQPTICRTFTGPKVSHGH